MFPTRGRSVFVLVISLVSVPLTILSRAGERTAKPKESPSRPLLFPIRLPLFPSSTSFHTPPDSGTHAHAATASSLPWLCGEGGGVIVFPASSTRPSLTMTTSRSGDVRRKCAACIPTRRHYNSCCTRVPLVGKDAEEDELGRRIRAPV